MKKILMTLFVCLLLVGTISALEFDNVKSYNEELKKVTITNAFGLGGTIAEAELKTPQYNYVLPGTEVKVMEFEVNSEKDYERAIGDIKFYWAGEKDQEITRDYILKYKSNGEWVELDNGDIPKGKLRVGLFVEVFAGDYVDAIPTLYGKEVDEWAFWIGVTPAMYYQFNGDLSEYTESDLDLADLGSAADFVTGKLDQALNVTTPNVYESIETSNVSFGTGDFTVAYWAKTPDGGKCFVMGYGDPGNWGAASGWGFYIENPGDLVINNPNGDVYDGNQGYLDDNAWHRFVWTRDGTNNTVYVNNSLVNSFTDNYDYSVNRNLTVGEGYNTNLQNCTVDDLQIFKGYAWTEDDVATDWNNGVGLEADDFGLITLNVTLVSPPDNFYNLSNDITFNTTLNISGLESNLTNATVYLWHQNDTLLTTETSVVSGNVTNGTLIPVTGLQYAVYTWNIEACGQNPTTHNCVFAEANRTLTIGIANISLDQEGGAFETDYENYNVSFNLTSGLTPSGFLNWNGTRVSGAGTNTNLGGTNWVITKNIDVPIGDGKKNLLWEITSSNIELNTSITAQEINVTNLTICDTGESNTTYQNFTFKNETAGQESIEATITSSFEYWLSSGTGTVTKTLTLTNTTENPEYSLCFTVNDSTVEVVPSVTYDNAGSEARIWSPGQYQLSNTVTDTTLFLLPTSAGIYVTIQVVNVADQVIEDAEVNVTRSGYGLIGSVDTDAAGSATFFLDPTATYTFVIFKDGYDVETTSLVPSQTSYTIVLGGADGAVYNDYTDGVTYTIFPSSGSLLNQTDYTFNFTINSTTWDLDEFGFVLNNGTQTLGSDSVASANVGTAEVDINTGLNTSVIMQFYWVVNDTYNNGTRIWSVRAVNDDHSINRFFTDLNRYAGEGVFGLTEFGLTIIIFLIIFISVGIMSFKFGLTSPASIMSLLFALVLFFDVGLGLIPNPVGAVTHFPTIFMAIILIAVMIRGAVR